MPSAKARSPGKPLYRPSHLTTRMQWLHRSLTKILPSVPTVTPTGLLKRASTPHRSKPAEDSRPPPAIVVTTVNMRLAPVFQSNVMRAILLKRAMSPDPSWNPFSPATVDHSPAAKSLRMHWFPQSVTWTLPSLACTISVGSESASSPLDRLHTNPTVRRASSKNLPGGLRLLLGMR